jgi:sugar fermentation stimulation protein A
MKYPGVVSAEFIRRPNRFVAFCWLDSQEVMVHVKNTGRCRELLRPGAHVFLAPALALDHRKTAYSLISVEKNGRIVNIDSQAPNKVWQEALLSGCIILPAALDGWVSLRQEVAWEDSRLDFRLELPQGCAFMEIKGVTLEDDCIARFPDAPTLRGSRHLRTLIRIAETGALAFVAFVIQMGGVSLFSPNDLTDPLFGDTLREAVGKGVSILAYDCTVLPDSIDVNQPIPILL